MHRLPRLLLSLCTAALLGACVAYPAPYPASYPNPVSNFDRSWDAAMAAAADAGVQISSAERPQDRIMGSKADAAVTIELKPRPDGSLEVSFNAPESREANPTLHERWLAAYQRRMGR